jgi:hypothetical protein
MALLGIPCVSVMGKAVGSAAFHAWTGCGSAGLVQRGRDLGRLRRRLRRSFSHEFFLVDDETLPRPTSGTRFTSRILRNIRRPVFYTGTALLSAQRMFGFSLFLLWILRFSVLYLQVTNKTISPAHSTKSEFLIWDFLQRCSAPAATASLSHRADRGEDRGAGGGIQGPLQRGAARQNGRVPRALAAGETLDDLLPEALATAREGAFRVIGQRAFHVQLLARWCSTRAASPR